MAFSGGVFSLVAGNPVTTATTISSTWANNTLSDIATNGLSNCLLKDGSQTVTANLPMSSFKLTGLAAGNANGDSIRYEQLFGTSGLGNGGLVFRSYLSGLALSTAGGSATMSIAAGQCADSTNASMMSLAAFSKTTSAWSAGTGSGGLDTGSIASSTLYYFYVIQRTDTGLVDVLISLSATSPTMPASYTLKRRIGAMTTDGSSHWTSFTQYNDMFLLTTPVQDANSATGASTRITVGTSVPPSFIGLFRITWTDGTNLSALLIQPIAETDAAVSTSASPGLSLAVQVLSQFSAGDFTVPVNASRAIALRSASTVGIYQVITRGWIDYRGKDV